LRSGSSTSRPCTNLGQIVAATHVVTSGMSPRRARTIILLLAFSVALMMTGFGIIMPVFARRFAELGAGVRDLALMTVSFALAQFLASPLMGSLADRIGRRPIILVALASFAFANMAYLVASSVEAYVAIRTIAGVFTAGLFPAAMGVVGDLMPESQRARWIGIVMGGYGAGLVLGPVIGGVLYDGWGFSAPFVASIGMAGIAFIAAAILVPETRPRKARKREELRERRSATVGAAVSPVKAALWDSLPRPLYVFGTLMFVDFIGAFAFAFFEPQMVFYVYEDLGWTTLQFGLIVGIYGLAMMIGQVGLGRTSDKLGRRPVIVLGTLLNAALYFGTAVLTTFSPMIGIAFVSGMGAALAAPALSAYYLDITAEQYRSRVQGIKGSALALGTATGPLLLVAVGEKISPQGVFVISGALMLVGALLALALLREARPAVKEVSDVAWEVSVRRSIAAQASLRGIVLRAASERATDRLT